MEEKTLQLGLRLRDQIQQLKTERDHAQAMANDDRSEYKCSCYYLFQKQDCQSFLTDQKGFSFQNFPFSFNNEMRLLMADAVLFYDQEIQKLENEFSQL
jgi:hypothetical protein